MGLEGRILTGDEGKAKDNADEDHFSTGKPELALAVPFNGKQVDDAMARQHSHAH